MNPYRFAIVGAGWRTEFFLRIAAAIPERFRLEGLVVRDAAKGQRLTKQWGHVTYRTVPELLAAVQPEFLVSSVSYAANYEANAEIASAFQAVSRLSSSPGHTRSARASYNRRRISGSRSGGLSPRIRMWPTRPSGKAASARRTRPMSRSVMATTAPASSATSWASASPRPGSSE